MLDFTSVPVFVHVPRTAGTKIRQTMGQWDVIQHRTAAQFRAKFGDEWEQIESFTVIRNPFSRLLSIFCLLHRNIEPTPDDFRGWVVSGMMQPGGLEPVLFPGTQYSMRVTVPQWEIVSIDGEIGVKRVFRFEEMPVPLEEYLGMSIRWSKMSDADDWERFYDSETEKIVRQMYRDDFERLGYA